MSNLSSFVWSIADQLRGVYKPHQYGEVVLPSTILRRLDCIMADTREQVPDLAEMSDGGAVGVQIKRKTGLSFYNTSEFDFAQLLEDPEGLRSNLLKRSRHCPPPCTQFGEVPYAAGRQRTWRTSARPRPSST